MSALSHRHTSSQLMACVVMVVAAVLFAHAASEVAHVRHTRGLLSAQPLEVVHAQEGDTIWNIACIHHVEGVSTYELVTWLYDRNDLSSSCLTPGQPLLVPTVDVTLEP